MGILQLELTFHFKHYIWQKKKMLIDPEEFKESNGWYQGPGAEKFVEAPAPAPLLFDKLWLWLQLQICSGNFTFQFEILIRNIYYKKEH